MKRVWLEVVAVIIMGTVKSVLLVMVLTSMFACATGTWASKPPSEKAIVLLTDFRFSWDEACTQEWLRCDVTQYADQAVDIAIDTIKAHPETWKSAAIQVIEGIRSRAQVNDLLGRWAPWLDILRAAIEMI